VATLSDTSRASYSSVTFSLITDALDNGLFHIAGNQIVANATLNRVVDSTYSLRVESVDQTGSRFDQLLSLRVVANQAPTGITLSRTSIPSGLLAGSVVGTLSTGDVDNDLQFSYTLAGSPDNAFFTISGNRVLAKSTLDRAAGATCALRVRVTDEAGAKFAKTLSLAVVANQAPTGIALSRTSISQGTVAGSTIATLTATDPDNGLSFRYKLAGVADNALFTLSGNTLLANARLDRAAGATYAIRVKAFDEAGAMRKKLLTLTAIAPQAPSGITLSNNFIASGTLAGSTIATLNAIDPDGGSNFRFTLLAGAADNALFALSGNTLTANSLLQRASGATYAIRVRVIDENGLKVKKLLTLNVA
jgi:hypothetical protein